MSVNPAPCARNRSRSLQSPTGRIALTERDVEVLVTTYLMRGLLRQHYQALKLLPGVGQANARLRCLYDHDYLRRAFVATGPQVVQPVYMIGRAAIPIIVAALDVDPAEVARIVRQREPAFLSHCLAVADTRVAFETGVPAFIRGMQWLAEPEVRHEYRITTPTTTATHILKPDGAIRLVTDARTSLHFLEVDRGTVGLGQWSASCASYRRYFERGLVREVYGIDSAAVLCVTTAGDRRIRRLSEAAAREALNVKFAKWSDLSEHGPFGAIWRSRIGDAPAPLIREVR